MNEDFSKAHCEKKFSIFTSLCESLLTCHEENLEMMSQICITHFYYMEIFRRLITSEQPKEIRIIRNYLIDYCVMIHSALCKLTVTKDGRLCREYDFINTPPNFIHTKATGSFKKDDEGSDTDIRLSICSVFGLCYLEKKLTKCLTNLKTTAASSAFNMEKIVNLEKNLLHKMISVKSVGTGSKNWELELVEMYDKVQQMLETKICIGYNRNGTEYSYEWIPKNSFIYRKYPGIVFSPESVNFPVNFNCELVHYNLKMGIIPDAHGCNVFQDLCKDNAFCADVTDLVDGKMNSCLHRSVVDANARMFERAAISHATMYKVYYDRVDAEIANSTTQCYW